MDSRELRVRLEANELARIEVPPDHLARLVEPAARDAVTRFFLDAGFSEVTLDLRGFRSGGLGRRGLDGAQVPAGELVALNPAPPSRP